MRSGSLMTPSIQGEVEQWTAAGYAKKDALAFVAYQRLGVKPEGVTISEAPEAKQVASALYASDTRSACNAIGLLKDPAEKIAIARRMGFGAPADAAAGAADPGATLTRLLKCGD